MITIITILLLLNSVVKKARHSLRKARKTKLQSRVEVELEVADQQAAGGGRYSVGGVGYGMWEDWPEVQRSSAVAAHLCL